MTHLRYTIGPDTLELGALSFTKDVPLPVEDSQLVDQALLPERVREYGFEECGPLVANENPADADGAGQATE